MVGRRCRAAQDFRAERQFCPARKAKIFVLRIHLINSPIKTCFSRHAMLWLSLCGISKPI